MSVNDDDVKSRIEREKAEESAALDIIDKYVERPKMFGKESIVKAIKQMEAVKKSIPKIKKAIAEDRALLKKPTFYADDIKERIKTKKRQLSNAINNEPNDCSLQIGYPFLRAARAAERSGNDADKQQLAEQALKYFTRAITVTDDMEKLSNDRKESKVSHLLYRIQTYDLMDPNENRELIKEDIKSIVNLSESLNKKIENDLFKKQPFLGLLQEAKLEIEVERKEAELKAEEIAPIPIHDVQSPPNPKQTARVTMAQRSKDFAAKIEKSETQQPEIQFGQVRRRPITPAHDASMSGSLSVRERAELIRQRQEEELKSAQQNPGPAGKKVVIKKNSHRDR